MPKRSDKPASNIGRRRDSAREHGKRHYLDRRREIARAAVEVFKERGLRGTTLGHVADHMGADRASLYYYISGKQDLFQEIVSEAVKVNLATASALRDDAGAAPDRLRRLIEGLMLSYAEYYPLLYVLIQENLNHVPPEQSEWAEEMKRVNREYERVLIDIIEEGQKDGTLRMTARPWLVAYGIMGMVGWTNRWFNPHESPVDAQEIGTAFADTILLGLAPDGNGGAPAKKAPKRRPAKPASG
jgi:TetR/AcrR family transcriptional regulator, cholesterol catabolism regulator